MRLLRNKLVVVALLLAIIHLTVVFAGFLAPYNYDTQHRDQPFMPPSRVHWYDRDSRFPLHPYICKVASSEAGVGDYQEDRSEKVSIHFFVKGDEYRLFGLIRCHRHLF